MRLAANPRAAENSGSPDESPVSAADRVCFEIVRALEQGRLVPGQRLVETELAAKVGVGRNAVREAIQRLAARGIVDVSRNRSPAIRTVDLQETMEVLEVAGVMFGLLARIAARNYRPVPHASRLRAVVAQLSDSQKIGDRAEFSAARREFYRALLDIAGNRELQRQFAGLQMQTIYAQYHSPQLHAARLTNYRGICECVLRGDVRGAEARAREHVRRVTTIIRGIGCGLRPNLSA